MEQNKNLNERVQFGKNEMCPPQTSGVNVHKYWASLPLLGYIKVEYCYTMYFTWRSFFLSSWWQMYGNWPLILANTNYFLTTNFLSNSNISHFSPCFPPRQVTMILYQLCLGHSWHFFVLYGRYSTQHSVCQSRLGY